MIYQPKEDSYLLEKEVRKYANKKRVLDIGSGSGIQAKEALEARAESVLCADISNKAVRFLKKEGFNAIQSDLFENVEGKFDLIVFNPPYLPRDSREDPQTRLQTTGGKKGDEVIVKFLKNVRKYLINNGIILIVFSSLTPRRRILKIMKEKGLKKDVLSEEKFFMEKLEVWKIYSS